jgi:DNA repair protein RadA/Sms
MSKKARTVFICQECGAESPRWAGQCICGAWNTMVEEKILPAPDEDRRRRSTSPDGAARPEPLRDIRGDAAGERLDTGIGELNRVLGGGLVKGSLTLISGEPGIGKSTIIMQAAANIARTCGKVLYVSGEESGEQIKMRADRICPDLGGNLYFLAETNIGQIAEAAARLEPVFLIIDSIQTMYTEEMDSAPGSVSQVRACGNELMQLGKTRNLPVFIVAHVTKTGELAGPKIVEHLVDCVLNLVGERSQELRILRAYKNRFGNTSEIGAFEMAEEGLKEIENLSAAFLESMEGHGEGSVVTAAHEGSRSLLLEVQALAAPVSVGFPRRSAIGVDLPRLNMILAVLERKGGLPLATQDVYVNVVGGLKPEGTSTDLAVALAVYSSFRGTTPPKGTLALGEVGLTGELRAVQNAEKMVREAARMGFARVILPRRNAERLAGLSGLPKELVLVGVRDIREAMDAFRG